jgi:transcription initiation factor TFIIB
MCQEEQEERAEVDAQQDQVEFNGDELVTKKFFICKTCNEEVKDPIVDEGKKVCRECGSIICDNITFAPEFRFYGNENGGGEDNVRCGIPFNPMLPKSSMGTIIMAGSFHGDEMKRIKRYHNWNVMPYDERSRYHVFDKISNICIRNGIPQRILHEAQALYIQISQNSITRGSKRRGIIAGCLYYACKNIGFPRNAKEIAKMFDINNSEMRAGCKYFQEIMTTNDIVEGRNKVQAMSCSTPKDFIPRYCSHLNISDKMFIDLAIIISERAVKSEIVSENTPPSIACGVIYLLSELLRLGNDIKTIHEKCDISVVTINKCFKNLWKNRKKIVPRVINDNYDKKSANGDN